MAAARPRAPVLHPPHPSLSLGKSSFSTLRGTQPPSSARTPATGRGFFCTAVFSSVSANTWAELGHPHLGAVSPGPSPDPARAQTQTLPLQPCSLVTPAPVQAPLLCCHKPQPGQGPFLLPSRCSSCQPRSALRCVPLRRAKSTTGRSSGRTQGIQDVGPAQPGVQRGGQASAPLAPRLSVPAVALPPEGPRGDPSKLRSREGPFPWKALMAPLGPHNHSCPASDRDDGSGLPHAPTSGATRAVGSIQTMW